MAEGEQKFRLSWRPHEPVLDYALWGYWATADARMEGSDQLGDRSAAGRPFLVHGRRPVGPEAAA